MYKAEIISIGSELLSGKTADTTSKFISRKLTGIGVTVIHKTTVPDQAEDIIKAVKLAWKRSSILIITGGLGPTQDDITKNAVAKAFGLKMKCHPQTELSIRQFYKKLHKKMPLLTLNQAYLPEGSKPLKNSWGTAPGIYIKWLGTTPEWSFRSKATDKKNRSKTKMLFILPGVPHETTNMMTYRVMPLLIKEFGKTRINTKEINIFGIGESTIQEKLEDCSFPRDIAISYLPETGGVKLVLSGNAPKKEFWAFSRKIQNLFKDNIYSTGEITLEQALGKVLKQKKYHLAVAESCTGGLLSSRIVNVSGASSYFTGGVIAYSNKAKMDILRVPSALLKKHGAVSIPVAKALAKGAAKKFSAECGIGITGVAGPKGGTRQKPVGYVCIASCCGKKILAESFHFYGDRSFIRDRAVATALFQMLTLLKKK